MTIDANKMLGELEGADFTVKLNDLNLELEGEMEGL